MLKLREIASIWFKVTASGPYIDTAFTIQSTHIDTVHGIYTVQYIK